MTDAPIPVFRSAGELSLRGKMALYDTHAEAAEGIPEQWRRFLGEHPALKGSAHLYGASPCTNDGKIHYLSGISKEGAADLGDAATLILVAGEYAVVRVEDAVSLRETWSWLLGSWLAGSGRRERNAPEFERYAGITDAGTPLGSVEIWIPLEARD